MDIETAATAAIKNRIADTDLLSQFINERDKEPVWDGAIYAYKSANKTNENLIGRAPVQVKGKLKSGKNNKKKSVKYPVSVDNLTHYRKDGGVLYFVVYIDEEKEKKIFYAPLLPYLLNQYIRMSNGKKSVSINLKEFPEKDTDFENVVINFVNDRHRQMQVINGKNWSIQEVTELLGVNNIKMNVQFTCIGYDRNNPFEYLKDNDFYLYAQNEDGSLSFPVEHIEHFESMSYIQNVDISVNGNKYYEKIKVEKKRDESTLLHIGNCVQVELTKRILKFQYALKGTLREQIRTIRFLLDVIDDNGLYINESKLSIHPTSKELAAFNRTAVENRLKYFEMIKKVLDRLGIKKDLDLESLDHKQEDYLRMLINTLLFKKSTKFKEKADIPPAVTLKIANIKVLLLFREMDDESYEVKDFFRTEIECKLDRDGEYPTTQFGILRADDFVSVDNLDWETIEKGFKSFDNEGHYQRMILSILELIKAYDKDHTQIKCLEVAQDFCVWLLERDSNSIIYKINYFQCIRRVREFNDIEFDEIEKCLQEKSMDEMSRAALNILMGNMNSAERIIKRLPQEKKTVFEEYPIYQLYKS